ncbi:hypothetical protein QR680_011362 [Steinernema hermaphroditum]|uniref:Uncharacterized protein n=1 Tax=Steinernema hermaphroditum TaxID=289476 RepID=A0AA39ITU1_9BILA|nr:hypothetical protein QR680_011362 [Steinernema hermaphroditum]
MERDRSPSSSSDEWSVVDEDSFEYHSDSEGSESDVSSAESIRLDENRSKSPSPVILEDVTISVLSTPRVSTDEEESAGSEADSDAEEVKGEKREEEDVEEMKDEAEEEPEKIEEKPEKIEDELEKIEEKTVEVVEETSEDMEAELNEETDERGDSTSPSLEDIEVEEAEDDDDCSACTEVESLSSDSEEERADDIDSVPLLESSDDSEIEIIKESEVASEPAARYFMNPEKAKDCFKKKQNHSELSLGWLASFLLGFFFAISVPLAAYCLLNPVNNQEATKPTEPRNSQCDLLPMLDSMFAFDKYSNPIEALKEYSCKITRSQSSGVINAANFAWWDLAMAYKKTAASCKTSSGAAEGEKQHIDVKLMLRVQKYLSDLTLRSHRLEMEKMVVRHQADVREFIEVIDRLKKEAVIVQFPEQCQDIAKLATTHSESLGEVARLCAQIVAQQKKDELVEQRNEDNSDSLQKIYHKTSPEEPAAQREHETADKKEEPKAEIPAEKVEDEWKQITEAVRNLSSTLKRNVPRIAKELSVTLNTRLQKVAERIRAKKTRISSFFSAESLKKAFEDFKRTMGSKENGDVVGEETCHQSERPKSMKPCEQHALIPSKGAGFPVPMPSTENQVPPPCPVRNRYYESRQPKTPVEPLDETTAAWTARRAEGRDQIRRSFLNAKPDWLAQRSKGRDQLRRRPQPCDAKRKWSYEARANVRSKLRVSEGNTLLYGYGFGFSEKQCRNVPKEHLNRMCPWKQPSRYY